MDSERLVAALGDQYHIGRELGGGGMAHVYLAEERALGRRVVIKVLANLAGGVSADRFRQEIQFAARLQHPGIVPLLSADVAGDVPFYTMPFVEGDSLRSRINSGPLTISEVIRVARDIAEALSYAHECGIVHRDLKPENVLLTRRHAMLTDFGVAKALHAALDSPAHGKLTAMGVTVGTAAYMAPEQAAADQGADHRVDLYSLGVVLFEMLAGVPPFSDHMPSRLMAAHVIRNPEHIAALRNDVPPSVAELVMRLLAKDPNDRPQSADAVLDLLESAATAPHGADGTPTAGHRRRIAAVGAALVLLVVSLVLIVWKRPGAGGTDTSLAVLPLVNHGDAATDYLSDGLSDQLISSLSRVERLRVAARTSSFAFKGQSDDVRDIAARLGVSNILEGSVQRAGNRVRVQVQLTGARDGFTLWSETYDRELTDLFALQDEITRSIVSALKGRLSPQDSSAVRVAAAANPAAYDAFLRGLFQFNRRGRDGLAGAIELFEESIRHDTAYAPAHAGLAVAYITSGNWGFIQQQDAVDSAQRYAERAIALDPNAAEAHTALGDVMCLRFEFGECERALRRAMELNPGYWMPPYILSFRISPFGRFEEAILLARRAQQLDPLNPQVYAAVAKARYLQRSHDLGLEELRVLDHLADAAITHVWRSHFYRAKGQAALALEESKRGVEMSGASPNFLAEHARALLLAGRTDSASAIIWRLERLEARPSFGIAMYYASAQDDERTLAWLDSAYVDRSDWITMLARAPDFDRYRNNPRVSQLLKRLDM